MSVVSYIFEVKRREALRCVDAFWGTRNGGAGSLHEIGWWGSVSFREYEDGLIVVAVMTVMGVSGEECIVTAGAATGVKTWGWWNVGKVSHAVKVKGIR
jgi:hypothetical protein